MSTCQTCGESFIDKKALRSHKKATHPPVRRCLQCNKEFTTKKALRTHKAAEHQQRCVVCSKSFASQEAVQSHRRAKHPPQRNDVTSSVQLPISAVQNPPQPEYKCDKCNVALRSLERLARHQQEVHNKVKCDHCPRMFKNIAARDAHRAQKHPTHPCDSCDWVFATLETLEQHKRDTHILCCHYCTCQFPTDALRYQHELTQHPIHKRDLYRQAYNPTGSLAIKRYALPVAFTLHGSEEHPPFCSLSAAGASPSASSSKSSCVSSGSNLPGLESRADTKSWMSMTDVWLSEEASRARNTTSAVYDSLNDLPRAGAVDDLRVEYKCDQCNVALRSPERLARHQQEVHIKFKCNHCDHRFKYLEGRNQHEVAKHPPTHECEQCDNIFPSAELLAAHNRDIHRSFKCDHCENIFQSIEERDQHQTGHLTHHCDSCDWAFYTLEALEQHKRDGHDFYCRYCGLYFAVVFLRDQHEYLTHKCQLNSESPSRHKEASHSLPAFVNQVPMCRSASGSSSLSVGDASSLSSPFTLHQSDSSTDSDAGWLESRSASESRVAVEKNLELSEDISPAVSNACRIPENEPDNHYDMPDVHSGPNCVSPDEHQAVHTCPSCRCIFESEEDRQIHECNSSRKREIPIHCRFCYSQFEDEASLQQHLTERISITCDKCNLQFCSDFILQDHIETHPTCRKCGQSFTHESELYQHIEDQHPIVVCWDCDGAIISEDSLELHCATEHPPCTICGARMISSDALLEHINEEHPGMHTMIEHLLDPVDTQNTFELHQSDFLNRDDNEMSSDGAESKENGTSEHRDATHTKLDTEESVRGLHDVTGQNRIVSPVHTDMEGQLVRPPRIRPTLILSVTFCLSVVYFYFS